MSAVRTVQEAMRRIRAHPEAMRLLSQIAPDRVDLIISLIAHGEYWYRNDQRPAMAKPQRDDSLKQIQTLARDLAAALRASPWPGLALQEVQRPQDDQPIPLADHLDWLSGFAAVQTLDHRHMYPPAASATNGRMAMLRHVKHTLRQNGMLPAGQPGIPALSLALARAVLKDETIDEEALKKA